MNKWFTHKITKGQLKAILKHLNRNECYVEMGNKKQMTYILPIYQLFQYEKEIKKPLVKEFNHYYTTTFKNETYKIDIMDC